MPLVSILIPAFNHEAYVGAALLSATTQDYPRVEIVLIDDGSSDQTLARAREIAPVRNSMVRVISQKNAGLCTTLNRLVAESKGKYIRFLASDDELEPGTIKRHVEALERHPDVAGVYGRRVGIDAAGNFLGAEVQPPPPSSDELFFSVLLGPAPCSLQSTTLRADVVREIGFDESLPFEDYDFFVRLTRTHPLLQQPEIAFRYRILSGGMNKNVRAMLSTLPTVFRKVERDPRVYERRFEILARICMRNAQTSFVARDNAYALHWIREAAKVDSRVAVSGWTLVVKALVPVPVADKLRSMKRRFVVRGVPR